MSPLTRGQIQAVAQNAGFSGVDLETAVAIAFAESSGKPDEYDAEVEFFKAHGMTVVGRGSCGLWQIFRFVHPEFDGWNLDDPQVNACAAYLTYAKAGRTFAPWSTFTSGAYKKFLEGDTAT